MCTKCFCWCFCLVPPFALYLFISIFVSSFCSWTCYLKCRFVLVVIELLRNLIVPVKLDKLFFKELVEVFTKHYSPWPSQIVQRYKFHSRFRKPSESVSTFLSELRALSKSGNFGETLDVMLRNRLVCGINDANIQNRLLSEPSLTPQRAMELAESLETASKQRQINGRSTHKIRTYVLCDQPFVPQSDKMAGQKCPPVWSEHLVFLSVGTSFSGDTALYAGTSSSDTAPEKKAKRQVTISTFEKWQRNYNREHQTLTWLRCDKEKQDKSLMAPYSHLFVTDYLYKVNSRSIDNVLLIKLKH